jgi:alkylation response protein AidB-like acyl-CoA dehydrogenase
MASHITFDGVELDGDAVIGEVDGGREVLNAVLTAGRIGAAAEGVGVARGAMDLTVDYLKQRKQFGKAIGEFQALQHRASHLYSEVEIARAVVIKAQQLLDAAQNEGATQGAELMSSVAKAKVAKAAGLAVREGVQMHGGIGMTDEYDIGLYMKRDRALQEFLGDAYFHANRVAEMSGY